MINIPYTKRNFIKPDTSQVAIRVRWDGKQKETTFIPGVYADKDKWDSDNQRAKKNTTHSVRQMTFSASEINGSINDFHEVIQEAFEYFSEQNRIPTTLELKAYVNNQLGREEKEKNTIKLQPKKTFDAILKDFLVEGRKEKNWNYRNDEKYQQAVKHLTSACKGLRPENVKLEHMLKLKNWYINNPKKAYKNRTITKQFTMLVAFLRWINEQPGYKIPDNVLHFSPHLKVIKKNVKFLSYEELEHFASCELSQPHLRNARDLWCFMAYTSLRYSDLVNLKVGHIHDNMIEMVTQKTSDRITIQLSEGALRILNKYKYKPTEDGHVFSVPSNQKMNDYIKVAAKEAQLDRFVIDTYYVGTERKEDQRPLH